LNKSHSVILKVLYAVLAEVCVMMSLISLITSSVL